ncbi:hypothetical protein AHAT_18220 [Agarivorans sp. Toyoura001]|nr:hypothetical protein AHAT_18220 [Agarivorans sp. Toyoura001]
MNSFTEFNATEWIDYLAASLIRLAILRVDNQRFKPLRSQWLIAINNAFKAVPKSIPLQLMLSC